MTKPIRTYAMTRPFGDFAMPVPAQNSCMREYAASKGLSYSLPSVELIYDHCFINLFSLLQRTEMQDHVCCYSFLMLPLRYDQKFEKLIEITQEKCLTWHFVFEKQVISRPSELRHMLFNYKLSDLILSDHDLPYDALILTE